VDRPLVVGRYAIYEPIASGGMATVHMGRLVGAGGFSRTVAIKRLHGAYAKDPSFVAMMLDEARIASRIRHPNVVPILDVVAASEELFVVMEYVHGASLARLLQLARANGHIVPAGVAAAIMVDVLHGLHEAHEATSDRGAPLGIVHRDVSPHNVLVGIDGVARVTDFGVAKAAGRVQTTNSGEIKGKLRYLAPEQLRRETIDRGVDIYAASICLWEALTGERLFDGESEATVLADILHKEIPRPSQLVAGIPEALEEALMRGLSRAREERWPTAREMALAIEDAVPLPREHEIGEYVRDLASRELSVRSGQLVDLETRSTLYHQSNGTERIDKTATLPSAPELPEAPAQKRSRIALVVVPALFLVTSAIAATLAITQRTSPVSPSPSATASTAEPVATEDAPSASVSGPAAPLVTPTSAPTQAAASTRARARRPPPAPSTTTKSGDPCDPPFIIDSGGIRVPKRECLLPSKH
jgi:eukaryotic-like serine/threonine-protein kinase